MKLRSALIASSVLLAAPTLALGVSPARDGGRGGVTLRATVPAGEIVNTGDRIAFEYQTREPAAVVVFSIDSRGLVHLLHPLFGVEVSRANQTYAVPGPGSELVVDGRTGVEFVFALAVPDPSAVDAAELARLRDADIAGAEPYRISGDPFIAANMIAGDLVRGVSRRDAVFGYTHFYVNERVEYPCYLCGACDGAADDAACTDYRIVQNFDRRTPLSFPLRRGYDMIEPGDAYARDGTAPADIEERNDVVVNFYPYGSEVRYVDPVVYVYYDHAWGLWDPFYWYWPGYYPYCGTGWSVSMGWGWGWGWRRGYYCSGWYAPPYDYHYYPRYRSDGYSYPEKFKAKYRSDGVAAGTLTANRTRAAQRDGSLRIAQKDVQRSVTKINRAGKPWTSNGRTFASGRAGSPRVKTSVWTGAGGRKSSVRTPSSRTGQRPSGGVMKNPPRSRGGSGGAVKPGVSSRPRGSSSGTVKNRPRGSSGSSVKGNPPARGSSGGAVKGKSGSRDSSNRGSGEAKSRGSSSSRSRKR